MHEMQFFLNKCVVFGKTRERSIRRSRNVLQHKIDTWKSLDLNIYFITFTFEEEYTKINFKQWNRKRFYDYIKTFNSNFILYNDFGNENGRFHLHGIVATLKPLDLSNHNTYYNKFGFTYIKPLKNDISKYVVKYSVKFEVDTFRRILCEKIKKNNKNY